MLNSVVTAKAAAYSIGGELKMKNEIVLFTDGDVKYATVS